MGSPLPEDHVYLFAPRRAAVSQQSCWNRHSSRRRRIDVTLFVILLAILAAGCSSAGRVAQPSGSPHALSAQIVLPTRTMTAGSSIKGRVVVRNNTGRAIHTSGCLTLFQVALTSSRYHPDPLWLTCLQPFTIPVGVSRYRITVAATYLHCGDRPSPACLPGGGMPPLAAGKYLARLFQSRHLVQTPPGLRVRVIAAAPAGG